MTSTAYVPLQETSAASWCNRYAWSKFFAAIAKGPTPSAQDAMAAYLHRHQHDLPPAVWIELERRRLFA